jgi:hypothetical protein
MNVHEEIMAKEPKRSPVPRPRKKEKESQETKESKEIKAPNPVATMQAASPTPAPQPPSPPVIQPAIQLVEAKSGALEKVVNLQPQAQPRKSAGPVADYMLESFYNKEIGQWVVTVAEFPELKAMGSNRVALIEEVETRLEDELEILRRRGEPIPEPIHTKEYPAKLEVTISRSLYRKLDVLSRQERVGFETVVTELLTSAIARRFYEGGRSFDKRASSQPPPRHSGQPHNQHRHNGNGNGMGANGNVRNRPYHDSAGNSDNFLEYVRNLEKGGGAPSKWRK